MSLNRRAATLRGSTVRSRNSCLPLLTRERAVREAARGDRLGAGFAVACSGVVIAPLLARYWTVYQRSIRKASIFVVHYRSCASGYRCAQATKALKAQSGM